MLPRGGGQAAGGAGGRELRSEARRAHDASGWRRRGVVPRDGAVGGADGGLGGRRRRGAGAQAVEGGRGSVRRAGRHGGAGETVGDRRPGGQGRRPGGHARGEGRRAVGARARRRGRPAHSGRLRANASRSDAPSPAWRARRTTASRRLRRAGTSPVARRLLRELAAVGHAPDDVGVCIGDGAAWLRRLVDEWFPNGADHRLQRRRRRRPCVGVPVGRGRRPLRPRHRPRQAMGGEAVPTAQGRSHGRGAGAAASGRRRRMRQGGTLHRRAPRPDALRRVPRARPADRLGARRGR